MAERAGPRARAPPSSPTLPLSPFAFYLTRSHCGSDLIAAFLGPVGTAQLHFVCRDARRLWPLLREGTTPAEGPEWLAHPLLFRHFCEKLMPASHNLVLATPQSKAYGLAALPSLSLPDALTSRLHIASCICDELAEELMTRPRGRDDSTVPFACRSEASLIRLFVLSSASPEILQRHKMRLNLTDAVVHSWWIFVEQRPDLARRSAARDPLFEERTSFCRDWLRRLGTKEAVRGEGYDFTAAELGCAISAGDAELVAEMLRRGWALFNNVAWWPCLVLPSVEVCEAIRSAGLKKHVEEWLTGLPKPPAVLRHLIETTDLATLRDGRLIRIVNELAACGDAALVRELMGRVLDAVSVTHLDMYLRPSDADCAQAALQALWAWVPRSRGADYALAAGLLGNAELTLEMLETLHARGVLWAMPVPLQRQQLGRDEVNHMEKILKTCYFSVRGVRLLHSMGYRGQRLRSFTEVPGDGGVQYRLYPSSRRLFENLDLHHHPSTRVERRRNQDEVMAEMERLWGLAAGTERFTQQPPHLLDYPRGMLMEKLPEAAALPYPRLRFGYLLSVLHWPFDRRLTFCLNSPLRDEDNFYPRQLLVWAGRWLKEGKGSPKVPEELAPGRGAKASPRRR